MATSSEEPPGGGGTGGRLLAGGAKSYAALLSSNLPSVWNKNVLEIILEKDARGSFIVSEEDCAKVMGKLGLDPRPGIHVESVQICPNGRGVLLITLKKEVPIDRFCHHDVFQVTQSGIRAVQVKPSGKREVVVTLKGVHPNTRDDGVMDYLAKFGKVTTTKVVYAVFGDGPLKGFRNGDRLYKLEIKANSYLGTYHVIDGQRVTARYPGQKQTCARCFYPPQSCPGKGMAKRCEQEGGLKVEFNDYIHQLWAKIGYNPSDVELDTGTNIEHSQESDSFTPFKTTQVLDPSSFTGVRVSNFPRDTDHGMIVEFLINSGLSEGYKDNISVKQNGSAVIDSLPNQECTGLIAAIHNKINFGRKLFCNGVVPLTPDKPEQSKETTLPNCNDATITLSPSSNSTAQPCPRPHAPLQSQPQDHQGDTKACSNTKDTGVCDVVTSVMTVSPMTPNTFTNEYSETPDISHLHLSNEELVRRNSLSLRTPPSGSLASEILGSNDLRSGTNTNTNYTKAKNILSNLREMADRYSDFASCDSSLAETDSEPAPDPEDGFKIHERKRKSRKHKLSPTPTRDFFLKKPNTARSPEDYSR